ncbi:Multidrug resistance protein MdtA precursor [Stieleria maiorica]|uniref:Multidrug resistance protein MdtA n=1 Tax=Stieleria maiorica TaxID=2795974 RepID=A0A5B9MGN6_9BACT|nr:efflux RND transporter periplasmic adaptor subunit [Stieleria maiorica]QEG00443.1 Multidrug resistance protein MdtA precursor [Stieleria maiorica]
MANNDTPQRQTLWRLLRVAGNALACFLILGASAAAIVVINRTEPTAQQISATRKSAALVETISVRRGTFRPRLSVLGTVEPAQDIVLSPRVSGPVIELSPRFVPGGMVHAGDLLLRIDPADFENALSIRKSELEQAKASLEIEQGRQSLAEKELSLLEGTIGDANRSLVLREPQIASIRAEFSAAQAAVERAELDLQRTSVAAPFDAQILSRSVNVGSQVSPGDELARLVGIGEYWVMAAVPVRSLPWVQFPGPVDQEGAGGSKGSAVRLRNPGAWPPGAERLGQVARMIGTLDQQTRLARVLVTVPDPLGESDQAPPLILDTLIETEIEGKPIEDVVRLDRKYIRDSDTVWVMKDDVLEIRETEIVFRDAEYAYIRQGLADGEEVVVTTLATVADGIGLRKIDDASDPAAGSDEELIQ